MNYQELAKLSHQELEEKLKVEKELLAKLTFAHAVTPLDNPMRIRKQRKHIARTCTALNSKLPNT